MWLITVDRNVAAWEFEVCGYTTKQQEKRKRTQRGSENDD